MDLVARAHHLRKIDFRSGVKLGRDDQIVTYLKPAQQPCWMSSVTYRRLPSSMQIRQLRYQVEQQGFRTRTIILATTLLDAQVYTADELANLYRRRWDAELHLRSLKTHMQMEHLRCKTPAMVRKEFYTHLLAYNLIRGMMLEAAVAAGVCAPPVELQGRHAVAQHLPGAGHR